MNECLFCKIIAGEIPTTFIHQSDNLVVFSDINPSADTHLLIVPKKHIKSFRDLTDEDAKLLTEIYQTASKIVSDQGLDNDLYRVVVNGGKAQHIPHLHFHLLGGQWKKQI